MVEDDDELDEHDEILLEYVADEYEVFENADIDEVDDDEVLVLDDVVATEVETDAEMRLVMVLIVVEVDEVEHKMVIPHDAELHELWIYVTYQIEHADLYALHDEIVAMSVIDIVYIDSQAVVHSVLFTSI